MTTLTKIGLVFINLLFWTVVIFIGYNFEWNSPPFNTTDGTYYPTMLWGNFFNALVVYLNAFLLYPFRKKLWLPYWLTVMLLILGTSIAEALVDYALAYRFHLTEQMNNVLKDTPIWVIVFSWFFRNIFIHLAWYILSFALVFFYEYYRNQQIQQALEQEKLKAELKFLKAQINPHFLFNGINSVYHLIDQKPEIAKSTLLNFSNLLRYQLYECNDDFIPLEKELDHIRDYVAMEKIRRGEDVQIELELPNEINQIKIPPLLFTPFIENAFKYVSNHDNGADNKINLKIRLQQEDNKLRFEVQNTVDEKILKTGGGIGIENVKKRLNLIFPKRHDLDIFKETNQFVVRMSLSLLPHSQIVKNT